MYQSLRFLVDLGQERREELARPSYQVVGSEVEAVLIVAASTTVLVLTAVSSPQHLPLLFLPLPLMAKVSRFVTAVAVGLA